MEQVAVKHTRIMQVDECLICFQAAIVECMVCKPMHYEFVA